MNGHSLSMAEGFRSSRRALANLRCFFSVSEPRIDRNVIKTAFVNGARTSVQGKMRLRERRIVAVSIILMSMIYISETSEWKCLSIEKLDGYKFTNSIWVN